MLLKLCVLLMFVGLAMSVQVSTSDRVLEDDIVICPTVFYECPANSQKSANRPCLTSFADCECGTGFIKQSRRERCKLRKNVACIMLFYECPANSMKRDKSVCKTSFADCQCFDGFTRNDDTESCDPSNSTQ